MARPGSAKRFVHLDPGDLIDQDLQLILVRKSLPDARHRRVPDYLFEMRRTGTRVRMGRVSLRVSNDDHIVLYAGHIGYEVEPHFRGRHYAARSCKLLFPLARQHGLNPLWITCNPDNWPSRRTCERAGGQLVEIVPLPPNTDMFLAGERQKCRYRFDLD
jgi:tagatose 1,6-diphosphate aldolase